MENFVSPVLSVLLAFLMLKLLIRPAKWMLSLTVHAVSGFFCLWLVNTASGITGFSLPLNAVTVLISGFCGLPGMALIALLEFL